jgi:hypothetical protein
VATTTTRKNTLSPEELEQMFALIGDSDSVELKLTVPESDQRSTVAALGMDPLDAELRQVYFFDTPDLAPILELSTKCAPIDAAKTAVDARAFLESKSIDLSGDQQTKTKTALDYFSQALRASGSNED